MSIFKPFITSDVIVSPFKVNKSFTFTGNELTGSNVQIDRFLGKNITASLWISGSDNTGYITSQSSQLVYRSIKELYYSNYISGSNGSPAATASLKVGDVIYEHGIITITNSGTTPYSSTLPNNFYSGSLTCSFESTVTIHETQYKCTIRENEFNFSNNPSLTSGSAVISNGSGSSFPQPGSGKLNDNVTGSYFSPYITTVGLYNNNKELLAVAKLAQPLPVSSVTDTSILINFDF